MIPRAAITQWAGQVMWPAEDQVEQDLVLSRLIVEIEGPGCFSLHAGDDVLVAGLRTRQF